MTSGDKVRRHAVCKVSLILANRLVHCKIALAQITWVFIAFQGAYSIMARFFSQVSAHLCLFDTCFAFYQYFKFLKAR
jgi:hypothetical protein